MSKWAQEAAEFSMGVRRDDAEAAHQQPLITYDDNELRAALMHTRQDVAGLFSLLVSANNQLDRITGLLSAIRYILLAVVVALLFIGVGIKL